MIHLRRTESRRLKASLTRAAVSGLLAAFVVCGFKILTSKNSDASPLTNWHFGTPSEIREDESALAAMEALLAPSFPEQETPDICMRCLNPRGKQLLDQCRQDLEARKQNGSSTAVSYRKWKLWPIPELPKWKTHIDLGWAVTMGAGIQEARVNEETCFFLAVKTKTRTLFDQDCLQRASFIGELTSVEEGATLHKNLSHGVIRLAAEVTYLPNISMHRVCYEAPHPGKYRLQLRLMFTNTYVIQTSLIPNNVRGFAENKLVVDAVVKVTGDKGFSFEEHREGNLPICKMAVLTETENTGFWVGNIWLPSKCRLRRLSPVNMLMALHKKNVLFLGDSQVRYLFGVLLTYSSMESRKKFLDTWDGNNNWKGSALEHLVLPKGASPHRASVPFDRVTSSVTDTRYSFKHGVCHFYGGTMSGFAKQHLHHQALQGRGKPQSPLDVLELDANITYSTYFSPAGFLFQDWKLNGTAPGGVKAWDGQPFDMVVEASLLHGVLWYNSSSSYSDALSANFVPHLDNICPKATCSFVAMGPLTGADESKWRGYVYKSNNARNLAFEDAVGTAFRQHDRPNFLHMRSLTVPVRGTAFLADVTHYKAPVNLAMLDMIFGSQFSDFPGELI